jgi:hypothetical protein
MVMPAGSTREMLFLRVSITTTEAVTDLLS